ncbi:MAG: hypothetical protein KAJ51_08980 [Thermoplasmata archaeon]|nr:hypothetical protein [Thermoplasmata archaeon]
MGEYNFSVRPDNPWQDCNCTIETAAPFRLKVPNVPLIIKPETSIATGDVYTVKRADHPTGLIVLNENNKPTEDMATLPVILTDRDEIILPLNGWPRGGGVIFL